MGPVANASVQGLNTTALLGMPDGCPEQLLSSTALNIYLYKYVKSVNQDSSHTEWKSIQYMQDGMCYRMIFDILILWSLSDY